MDSSSEKGIGSLDPGAPSGSGELKACTDCRTTKTPLWRGGPSGPKSLCNACGIRYRKKRREALGLDGGEGGAAAAAEKRKKKREEMTLELRMVGFGKEVVLKQRRMRRRRRLGEEEKAAILLMALSSGVIYA